jgi:hypothetical protein
MGIETVFTSHVPEAIRKIDETASDRMNTAVNEVLNKTLDTLSGTRHGRIYNVPGTHKSYTASAPGEPPAQATGTLRQSIRGGLETLMGKKLVGFVGTDKDYGRMLEYGTSRITARPWLRKSFEESEGKVKEIFTRLWFS